MNIHRKAKTGCEHVVKHISENCPNSPFNVQIIKILEGPGYGDNEICSNAQDLDWKERIIVWRLLGPLFAMAWMKKMTRKIMLLLGNPFPL